MFAIEWLIGIGIGAFVVGGGVGYLLRNAFGGSRKEADLAKALEATETELADYKQEVLERFSDTADKFKRLNDSYQDLHQQLAESAVALLGPDVNTPLLPGKPTENSPEDATADVEPQPDDVVEAESEIVVSESGEAVADAPAEPAAEEAAPAADIAAVEENVSVEREEAVVADASQQADNAASAVEPEAAKR